MKFIGHRFVFAAAAFLALSGKCDDAVGVMSIDAGTNGIVEAEMPFNAFGGNGPAGVHGVRHHGRLGHGVADMLPYGIWKN